MTWRIMARLAALTWALVVMGACGDDGVGPSPGDAGPADGGPPGPATLAPFSEPVAVDLDRWLVTYLRPEASDVLLDEALADALRPEGPGGRWETLAPGDNGTLTGTAGLVAYAVANVPLGEDERLFARVDGRADVFLRGARRPGDVYRSGTQRVPVGGRAGANWVTVRALDGRDVEVELFRTPDALVFNLNDVTAPDLIEGETGTFFVGVPILNLLDSPAYEVSAEVIGDEHFVETAIALPALAPAGLTQVAFRVELASPVPAGVETLPLTLRIRAAGLRHYYERTIDLPVVEPGTTHRRTFQSAIDGSAQYYGVVPPTEVDPGEEYGLVLSLHGAAVQAIGQARAYSPKDWTYIVAPTNRRPFGFDWEEWGRLDALEVFDDARARYRIDETRTHVTGHSMGGHGTWQLGVLFPGRWGLVGPSAGWASFETYGGTPLPDGPFGRARASSDTLDFTDNLRGRAVYVIHGDADDNVPVREARDMVERLEGVADPLTYHEQPDAGHWWDADSDEPGADCVDWEPMFAQMAETRRDPTEVDFAFESPSPGVSDRHAFVRVRSVDTPYANYEVVSSADADTVVLTTDNVRGMTIDGAALRSAGLTRIAVDGAEAVDLPEGDLELGPSTGKRPDQQGPFNQVFQRPFCFVYPDGDGPTATVYRSYAGWLLAQWTILGNGQGCAVPAARADVVLEAGRNVVWLGVEPPAPEGPDGFAWSDDSVTVDGRSFRDDEGVVFLAIYPARGGVSAVMASTDGFEALLFLFMPFNSRAGLPDWLVYEGSQGTTAVGFFDAEWALDPTLSFGL